MSREIGVISLALVVGCGSLAVDGDAAVSEQDAGRDGAARDAAGDGATQDAGRIDEAGADAPAGLACRSVDDCVGWPDGEPVFCDWGTCCAGRLDRFGCVCGELRGGCPRGQYCCDDNLHPEIIVGCSELPCEPQ